MHCSSKMRNQQANIRRTKATKFKSVLLFAARVCTIGVTTFDAGLHNCRGVCFIAVVVVFTRFVCVSSDVIVSCCVVAHDFPSLYSISSNQLLSIF